MSYDVNLLFSSMNIARQRSQSLRLGYTYRANALAMGYSYDAHTGVRKYRADNVMVTGMQLLPIVSSSRLTR